MKKEDIYDAFVIVLNTLESNYSFSEIEKAFAELNEFGITVVSSPRKLIGGSKAKYLLILSFLLSVLFYVFLSQSGENPFSYKNQDCLDVIKSKNLSKYPLSFVIKDAEAHVKDGTALRIYKPIAEACAHHTHYSLPEHVKKLQYLIYGLSALKAYIGINGAAIIGHIIMYIVQRKKENPGLETLAIADQQAISKAITETPKRSIADKSAKRSKSRSRLIGGSTIPSWMYELSGPGIGGGLRGGGGDVSRYFPVVAFKDIKLSVHIITILWIYALYVLTIYIYKNVEFFDAGTYSVVEKLGPVPTQMATARQSGLSAFPSPSVSPMYETIREKLTAEEFFYLNSTKIRGLFQGFIEFYFPSMRTLVSPTQFEKLRHALAVVSETAYFSYLIDLVVQFSKGPIGFGFLSSFGAAVGNVFIQYIKEPSRAKKLFMNLIGLVMIIVQLSLAPYRASFAITDALIVKNIFKASANVAKIDPVRSESIVNVVQQQIIAGEPEKVIASELSQVVPLRPDTKDDFMSAVDSAEETLNYLRSQGLIK